MADSSRTRRDSPFVFSGMAPAGREGFASGMRAGFASAPVDAGPNPVDALAHGAEAKPDQGARSEAPHGRPTASARATKGPSEKNRDKRVLSGTALDVDARPRVRREGGDDAAATAGAHSPCGHAYACPDLPAAASADTHRSPSFPESPSPSSPSSFSSFLLFKPNIGSSSAKASRGGAEMRSHDSQSFPSWKVPSAWKCPAGLESPAGSARRSS